MLIPFHLHEEKRGSKAIVAVLSHTLAGLGFEPRPTLCLSWRQSDCYRVLQGRRDGDECSSAEREQRQARWLLRRLKWCLELSPQPVRSGTRIVDVNERFFQETRDVLEGNGRLWVDAAFWPLWLGVSEVKVHRYSAWQGLAAGQLGPAWTPRRAGYARKPEEVAAWAWKSASGNPALAGGRAACWAVRACYWVSLGQAEAVPARPQRAVQKGKQNKGVKRKSLWGLQLVGLLTCAVLWCCMSNPHIVCDLPGVQSVLPSRRCY